MNEVADAVPCRPWSPEDGPPPEVTSWPYGQRPGVWVRTGGCWRWGTVEARQDGGWHGGVPDQRRHDRRWSGPRAHLRLAAAWSPARTADQPVGPLRSWPVGPVCQSVLLRCVPHGWEALSLRDRRCSDR
jgi:hypothetical protein